MDNKSKASLIAPCGMNCGLCYAYHRDKNKCAGCNSDGPGKPNYCFRCSIKNCKWITAGKAKYCYACPEYPCRRLKNLDKRYRTKYGMSMIGNLNTIKETGIREFIRLEKQKWACTNCGNTLCVHRESCLVCGTPRLYPKPVPISY